MSYTNVRGFPLTIVLLFCFQLYADSADYVIGTTTTINEGGQDITLNEGQPVTIVGVNNGIAMIKVTLPGGSVTIGEIPITNIRKNIPTPANTQLPKPTPENELNVATPQQSSNSAPGEKTLHINTNPIADDIKADSGIELKELLSQSGEPKVDLAYTQCSIEVVCDNPNLTPENRESGNQGLHEITAENGNNKILMINYLMYFSEFRDLIKDYTSSKVISRYSIATPGFLKGSLYYYSLDGRFSLISLKTPGQAKIDMKWPHLFVVVDSKDQIVGLEFATETPANNRIYGLSGNGLDKYYDVYDFIKYGIKEASNMKVTHTILAVENAKKKDESDIGWTAIDSALYDQYGRINKSSLLILPQPVINSMLYCLCSVDDRRKIDEKKLGKISFKENGRILGIGIDAYEGITIKKAIIAAMNAPSATGADNPLEWISRQMQTRSELSKGKQMFPLTWVVQIHRDGKTLEIGLNNLWLHPTEDVPANPDDVIDIITSAPQ